jgi:hypothetical protein
MPDLDHELRAAGRELAHAIRIPDLDGVRARSGQLRHRHRRRVLVGAAALVIGAVAALWPSTTRPTPERATAPSVTPPAEGWRGGGLTVLALNGAVLNASGDVYDVAFANRTTGYALAKECGTDGCTIHFLTTGDAGFTWSVRHDLAGRTAVVGVVPEDRLPRLAVRPGDESGVGVRVLDRSLYWSLSWQGWVDTTDRAPGSTVATINDGWLAPADGNGVVTVWTPEGTAVSLAHPPALSVCWVAPARTDDGAWWVGGRAGGLPAVANSRDDGATWTVTTLPAEAPSSYGQVSVLGIDTYASVVTPTGDGKVQVGAIYRSLDRGPFVPYAREVGAIAGDVVPLLDGRLVAADGRLLVLAPRQVGFEVASEELPGASRLEWTAGGYVAYDVAVTGFTAFSHDGVTWQKLNLD